MSGSGLEDAISGHIGGILLRYFRSAVQTGSIETRIDLHRDREMLRLHWSISPTVRDLTRYILANRHETQGFLAFRVRMEDAAVRGRLDARATVIQRLVTGHPSVTVAHEPMRSFASGPNHVVGWVLQQAWLLAGRFLKVLPSNASYRQMVEDSVSALDQVRKIEAIRAVTAEINVARRPSAGALQEAARSRRMLYRLAYGAFIELAALEAGHPDVIGRVLRDTLLAPIEVWRRFELAVGLSAAEALAKVMAMPLSLNLLAGDTQTPIARVGRFGVFWQTTIPSLYRRPPPEPSEAVTDRILDAYGMRPDADRPDVIIADLEAGRVVSVIEVKYFNGSGEDAWDRLRDATSQVVRYSRGYRNMDDLDGLLSLSLIALVRRPILPAVATAGVPEVVSFGDLTERRLEGWAHRLTQLLHAE